MASTFGLRLSDLQPHQSLHLSPSGIHVSVEDPGLPQGAGKSLTGPLEPPVMETGEAGPPGKMTSSKLPKGTDGSMMPVLGFAGAPGQTLTLILYITLHCI